MVGGMQQISHNGRWVAGLLACWVKGALIWPDCLTFWRSFLPVKQMWIQAGLGCTGFFVKKFTFASTEEVETINFNRSL